MSAQLVPRPEMASAQTRARRRFRWGLLLALGSGGPAVADAETAASDEDANAAVAEPPPKDRRGWLAAPVAGFSPETSVQLGALIIYFFEFDQESSLSSFPVLGIGTLREQFLIEVRPELFFDKDNYRIWTRFDLQRFPDSFFGIGNDVRESDKESYQREFVRVRTNLRRRVGGEFHAGLLSDHVEMDLTYDKTDGLFGTNDYVGESGGLTAGFGPSIAYDSRDHKNYPTRGLLFETSVTPFIKAFGSDYDFIRTMLDLRSYIPLGNRQLFAFHYYLESSDGEVPFYMLPQLGGPDLLRGYFLGKFREESLQAVQAEYRAHLVWKIGAAAFAGVGQVGEDFDSMWTAPVRASFGGGLRYNLKTSDDIVNLRVDFGLWPFTGDSGLYVAATEAF